MNPRATRFQPERRAFLSLIASAVLAAGCVGQAVGGPDVPPSAAAAERRALAYLAREVPRWSKENHCYSCHNNGDAARALLAAAKRKRPLADDALSDTLAWLGRPDRWDENGVNAAFSDKRLARLQFAGALASAVDAGAVADRSILVRAARRLADDQAEDGSWRIDEGALIGSPATYGPPLATAVARSTLHAADAAGFAGPIARADRWLRERPVRNILDASAAMLALDLKAAANTGLRRTCHELLSRAQGTEGGWGPFVNAPPETFDTALALLALARWPEPAEVAPMIQRGRDYLVASQSEDGSWPETTRPTGGESYAQRISTAGWATLALLATDR